MMRTTLLLLFSLVSFAAETTLKPVAFEEGAWRVGAAAKKPAFQALAVTMELWPAGLVPIFVVEKSGVRHLRRFPLEGQENISEPVFFGLPFEDEKPYLGGRWQIDAVRPTGKAFLYWELVMEGSKVAGRFDRYTDYRFGVISEAQFVSNRLEIKADYVSDSYALIGSYVEGKFTGSWRRTDDAEAGTWEARQDPMELPKEAALTNLTGLFEWRNGAECAYAIEGKSVGEGWVREERGLCQVWRVSQPK